jgi:hypothetical protein
MFHPVVGTTGKEPLDRETTGWNDVNLYVLIINQMKDLALLNADEGVLKVNVSPAFLLFIVVMCSVKHSDIKGRNYPLL